MKKATLLLNLIICFHFIYGQSPDIEWQNTIGSDSPDFLSNALNTNDGGYLISGTTTGPPNGDKTEPYYGLDDIWVIKLNNTGNIEWQKVLGGSKKEQIFSTLQLSDGNYLIAGSSPSNISGNKSQVCNGGTVFGDGWLVKLDASGNILWNKTFGGAGEDAIYGVTESFDGNYILVCSTPNGSHAQKAEIGNGGNDCWIIKVDTDGNIIWENTIGGAGADTPFDIQSLVDGSSIVVARSDSNISGDKTQNNNGALDYWLFKLNANGDIVWQNTIGGSNFDYAMDVRLSNDGGFFIGGYSLSGISGDKTEGLNNNNQDFWIVKTDQLGNIVWENSIGSNNIDYYGEINPLQDGGLLICGYNNATVGSDKSEANMGANDFWLLKLNSTGNIIWDEVIGGSDGDYAISVIQTPDLGILISGHSKSDISGDKTENIHTGPVGHYEDFWIIKFAAECIPTTEFCNAIDDNCNGLVDDGITETISITPGGPISFCQGGSVLLTATYSGASVQWKKNGTNIPGATSATYNVTTKGNYSCVTTSACGTAESTPIFVNVIKNPNASISAGGPTTFCAGGSVVLTEIAVAGCTYQWYKGASPIAGATSLTYTATTSGNYKCRVTKAVTGCYKNSNAIAVSVPCREGLPVSEAGEMVNEISINPNPASISITVETNMIGLKQVFITDVLGQVLSSLLTEDAHLLLDISGLPAGIYFVQISNEKVKLIEKIIIE